MGRYYHDKKEIVQDCHVLSTVALNHKGYFKGVVGGIIGWNNHSDEMIFGVGLLVNIMDEPEFPFIRIGHPSRNPLNGETIPLYYRINLVATPCHYGGVRYWFHCPMKKSGGRRCNRRVANLYLPSGEKYFGCRQCYRLAYATQNKLRTERSGGVYYPLELLRKIDRLKKQIKRYRYAGKRTKKAQKLLRLCDQLDHAWSSYQEQ